MAEEQQKQFAEGAQNIRKGLLEINDALIQLLPPDYLKHSRLARRERLLALRSGIDARIAATDRQLKASEQPGH
jgi:hypothetical protein